METRVNLAVNGTLMRGLELNPNLLRLGAEFLRVAMTEPTYRLWSIGDRHPAMQRVPVGGAAISLEVWAVPVAGVSQLLLWEPPGLCIGKVRLADGEEVLGVLGEAILCEGQPEITPWGGWRAYIGDVSNVETPKVKADMPPVKVEEWVDMMAALVDLPLRPEHRPGVVENFERIRAIAQQVMEFPLPEDIEAGPTFEP
jgi:hypothetical protein